MFVIYLCLLNCLKNNYVNSLYAVYVLVLILHVPYGNHRKMLGLTCLNNFLCMYMYVCITEGLRSYEITISSAILHNDDVSDIANPQKQQTNPQTSLNPIR